MAPKRKSAPAIAPPASPSESESSEELTDTEQQNPLQIQSSENPNPADSSDSDDEDGSDEEDEEKTEKNTKPSSEKSAQPHPDSDFEETDSDSDSDSSDSDPTPSASALKIQPKYDVAKPKMLAENPNASVSKSPPKKAVSVAKSNANESQKKGMPANGVAEEKKMPFTRIWGDDDELAVVQGMDKFREITAHDPCVDRDAYFEFMKKSLKIEFTKNQLMDKVRRLKQKYVNNVKRGGNPVISKPHELKLFELSKKVWGGNGVENSAKAGKRKVVNSEGVEDFVSKGEKSNKKAKINVKVMKSLDLVKGNGMKEGLKLADNLKSNQEGFWDSYPCFKEALEIENSKYFSKGGMRTMIVELSKFGAGKVKEMEDKWRGFYAKEMELKLLQSELVKEQTRLVLDAVKAAKS